MGLRAKVINFKQMAVTTLFVFSIVVAQFANIPFASAATLTWDGSAGDGKFSTAANWSGDAAPVAGDIITLPYTVAMDWGDPNIVLNNDLGVALGGITVGNPTAVIVGDMTSYTFYEVNNLLFQDDAVVKQQKSAQLYVSSSIVAQGGLVLDGTSSPFGATTKDITVSFTDLTVVNNPSVCSGSTSEFAVIWTPTATVNIGANSVYGLQVGTTVSSVTVGSGALLSLPYSTSPVTFAGNITFNGGGATQGSSCGSPASLTAYSDVTLTGTITMNAGDILYQIGDLNTLTVKGPIVGEGYALKKSAESTGTFVNNSSSNNSATPGGTQEVPVKTLPAVTDDKPDDYLSVASKTSVALDGTRGDVSVSSSGILKGTGTAATLYVAEGGTVAPGHSPGTLTVVESYDQYGTYQAELLNKDTYDQIVVGENYTGGSNAVRLGTDSILDLILYEGYSINKSDAFTLIDNRSDTAVSGTFAGLSEGTQFTEGNIVFSISYVGGDGNDIVVTALNTGSDPNAPNTGFVGSVAAANPAVVAGLGILTVIVLAAAMRRRSNN